MNLKLAVLAAAISTMLGVYAQTPSVGYDAAIKSSSDDPIATARLLRQDGSNTPFGKRLKKAHRSSLPKEMNQGTLRIPTAKKPLNNQVATASSGMPIYGNVTYATSWDNLGAGEIYPIGYYSFKPQSPLTLNAVHLDPYLYANGGGVIYDGKLHMVNYEVSFNYMMIYYYEFDINTWENTVTQQLFDADMIATDIAHDEKSGKNYGCFYTADGQGFEFGTIDYNDLSRDFICNLGTDPYVSISADTDGTIYGIKGDGNLYRIDKETGKATMVGNTGVTVYPYLQSATIDPNDGELYWAAQCGEAESALYQVDKSTGHATLIDYFPDNEMILGLYIPKAEAPMGAPARAADFKLNYPNGILDGSISFTIPTKTYGDNELKGDVNYRVTVSGDEAFTGTGQPGEHIEKSFSLTEGKKIVRLTLTNDAGDCPSTAITQWIGYDNPDVVTNILMTLNEETGTVSLQWNAPVKGTHDGYIDFDNLTYKIKRYPDNAIIAEGLSTTSYTDKLTAPELQNYQYGIIAVNKHRESKEAKSDKTVYGQAYSVPYEEDFLTESAMKDFIVIDNNRDQRTWEFHWDAVAYNYSEDVAGDDWLLTPPIEMKADRFYKLRFVYWSASQSLPETLSVALGKGTDPTTYTEIMPPTTLNDKTKRQFEQLIRVPEDGNYHIGYYASSPAGSWRLYVDKIQVLENNLAMAPDTVTNLKVTPAAMGQLKATVSFKAPTLTADKKNQLTELTKIDISRNGVVVKSISGPVPGQDYSVVDDGTDFLVGFNRYDVVAYNSSGIGLNASRTAYIGEDKPGVPRNIKARPTAEGIVISWDAPAGGENGGYIDTGKLTYIVQSADASRYWTDITGKSITDTKVELKGTQRLEQYIVAAVSPVGTGKASVSNSVVVGDPHSLPFVESFRNGQPENEGWYLSSPGMTSWAITSTVSADDDGGSALFFATQAGDKATLNSGKISLKGSATPSLMFTYFAAPGSDVTLRIETSKNGGEAEHLETIDFKEIGGTMGWRTKIIPLAKIADDDYMQLHFVGLSNDNTTPIILDNINVRNLVDHNLTASIETPSEGMAGIQSSVLVTVRNVGRNTAEGYVVRLHDGNGDVLAQTEGTTLPSTEQKGYELPFTPLSGYNGRMLLYAHVDYPKDEDTADNYTYAKQMYVDEFNFPTVSDLSVDAEGNLSWVSPDMSTLGAMTEDFESYRAWQTDFLGDWRMFDLDGGTTLSIYGLDYPLSYEPYAFCVFNPVYLMMDYDMSPNYKPHSGDQYMASFAVTAEYAPEGSNDDWMVSPKLTGREQTISVFAKSAQPSFLESFQILASSTEITPSSFDNVVATFEDIPSEWNEYTATLPAGTKYFAIRNISKDKLAIFIDDVTFDAEKPVVKGFNIYRDGKLVATVAAGQSTYTDTELPDGEDHNYQVSVIYDRGESQLSDPVNTAGISGIYADATVALDGGRLTVTSHEDVRLYSLAGIMVWSKPAAVASAEVLLPKGQYILAVGGQAQKLLVK